MRRSMLAIDVAHRALELMAIKDIDITACSYEEALKAKSSAEALAVSIYQNVDEALLSHLPKLRHIFVLGTSTKKIDMAYCKAHNIQISVVRHYCDQETAEWVMLQVLKFFRDRKNPMSVIGRRLGIIGLGDVGMSLKNLSQAFFMEVLVNSHKETKFDDARWASKEEILQTCDVVSFHTPAYTPWLTKDLYEQAKPSQLWINTCMGAITKEEGFADFMAQGRINLIMDGIAGISHQHLAEVSTIYEEQAFDTIDSQTRLKEKFLANIKAALG